MNIEGWEFATMRDAALAGELLLHLQAIVRIDKSASPNYAARERLVWAALSCARNLGFAAGVRIDSKEPEWPVVFIELPGAGQVSWHMPQHAHEWDGHTTEEKHERIARLVQALNEVSE